MNKRTQWAPEEDAILLALPMPITRDAAVKAMGFGGFDRTPGAIVARLDKLDLQRPAKTDAWTDAEDAALLKLVATGVPVKTQAMVEALAAVGVYRTSKSISSRASRLRNAAPKNPAVTAAARPTERPTDRRLSVARDVALITAVLGRVFVG